MPPGCGLWEVGVEVGKEGIINELPQPGGGISHAIGVVRQVADGVRDVVLAEQKHMQLQDSGVL